MYCTNEKMKKTEEDNSIIIVKDSQNNAVKEEETINKNCSKWKEDVARERWKLLAKALSNSCKESPRSDISVRRFSSFGLIVPFDLENQLEDCWMRYGARIGDRVVSIQLRLLETPLTASQLIGFNNTGNVCIWPSEEVLTWYLLPRAALFAHKTVLELGGGMTCLAGLLLAKYSQASKVHLTDGNVLSVENVSQIVDKNNLNRTIVSQLDWKDYLKMTDKYDVILSADCLFFDETRWLLVETLWHCLAPNGVALVMAPARGGTLHLFLQNARTRGFTCTLHAQYCEIVWSRHLRFRDNCPEYDENLHYPLLLLLTRDH